MGSSSSSKSKRKRRAGLALAAIALAMATAGAGNAQNCWEGDGCQGQIGCQLMGVTVYCDQDCSPTNCLCMCKHSYYMCVSTYCDDYECVCTA